MTKKQIESYRKHEDVLVAEVRKRQTSASVNALFNFWRKKRAEIIKEEK